MSTDRELQELAAKAAGLNVAWYGAHFGEGFRIKGEQGGYRHGQAWNPLTDDGDALRLVVKLCLDVHYETQFVGDEAIDIVEILYARDPVEGHCKVEMTALGADPAASTRRAITRAAAQIGKTNQPGEAG